MFHFINMFTLYQILLDKEKYLPSGIPILLVFVYFTVYLWVKNNKSLSDKNLNFIVWTFLFNFVGTILLMGFGIILTAPITVAYIFMIFSIALYRKSFSSHDTPKNVAMLITPIFMVSGFSAGYTSWFYREEDALKVFMATYSILSLLALHLNHKAHKQKPPMLQAESQEEPEKKRSMWV